MWSPQANVSCVARGQLRPAADGSPAGVGRRSRLGGGVARRRLGLAGTSAGVVTTRGGRPGEAASTPRPLVGLAADRRTAVGAGRPPGGRARCLGPGLGSRRPCGRGGVTLPAPLALQPLDRETQRLDRRVGLRVREPHERHVEQQARIGGVAELDERLAEHLEGPDGGRCAEPLALVGDALGGPVGELDQLGGEQRQEAVAELGDECLGQSAGVAPGRRGRGDAGEGGPRVTVDEGLDRCRRAGASSGARPPAATTCSSADSVSRAEPPPWRSTASIASSPTSSPASATTYRTCSSSTSGGQEVELEVLRAADDGGADLLGVGGGQDERRRGRAVPPAS